MRFPIPLSIAALAGTRSRLRSPELRSRVRPFDPARPVAIPALREVVEHYRTLTWTFERAARVRRTPTSFSYRHSVDRGVPAVDDRHLDAPRVHGPRRGSAPRPPPPRGRDPEASAPAQRALAPGRLHAAPDARAAADLPRHGHAALRERPRQDRRGDARALAAAPRRGHAAGAPVRPSRRCRARSARAFLCIHHYEGAWNANTGNGYYGGLQMDRRFQSLYGRDFVARWGTADNWPAWAQLQAAVRAYRSGRGFYPWPNTARACGLI